MLKHDVGFVACLYVDRPEDLSTYEAAAEKLILQREFDGIRLADDESSVCAFHDDVAMLPRLKGDIQNYRRVIFLFASYDLIPEEHRNSAEFVLKLGNPDIQLIRSAVQVYCGEKIAEEDARLIADAKWSDLNTAFRKSRSVTQGVGRLRRAITARAAADLQKVETAQVAGTAVLSSLHGYGDAVSWAERLQANLALSTAGTVPWTQIERGLLLYGPPGTGKSMFGRIVAEACGIPFIVASFADWQAAGHQGEMIAAMNATFQTVKTKAPCVLILEEIDCFDSRRQTSEHANFIRGCVNGLLQRLDEAFAQFGVVVIATTNFFDVIDEAILRPGRIDRHIEVRLPDANARVAILSQHLAWQLPSEQWSEVALATNAMSGAGLKKLADQVRDHCRAEGVPMSMEAVRTRLPKVFPIPPEHARVSALHECGHAIVGLKFGRTLARIELAEHYVEANSEYQLGEVRFDRVPFHLRPPTFLADEISVALGGMAAEIEFNGMHGDGVGGYERADLVLATDLATRYEALYGMGETLVSEAYQGRDQLVRLRQQNLILWRRIDDLLKRQLAATRRIINENREAIHALADRLVDTKSMTAGEVMEFLRPYGVGVPEPRAATSSALI